MVSPSIVLFSCHWIKVFMQVGKLIREACTANGILSDKIEEIMGLS